MLTDLLAGILDQYRSAVFFHVLTTGMDPERDQIIGLAAVRMIKKRNTTKENAYMNALIKLPAGEQLTPMASEITGITVQRLNNEGLQIKQVAGLFNGMLDKKPVLLISHNAHLQLQFLRKIALMNRRKLVAGKSYGFLDTMTIYKDRRRHPHKLYDALEEYKATGIDFNSKNRGLIEVHAIMDVLYSMAMERNDISSYINIFGYNQKYGIPKNQIGGVLYKPQGFKGSMATPGQTLPLQPLGGKRDK